MFFPTSISWKYEMERNKSYKQELSDKFVFLLCLYCSKRKKDWRNTKINKFIKYYEDNFIVESTIADIEPYKTILNQLQSNDIEKSLQIKMLEEYKKYADFPKTNNFHVFCSIIIFGVWGFFITLGVLLKHISKFLNPKTINAGNNTTNSTNEIVSKSISINRFPFISVCILLLLLLVIGLYIYKFISQKKTVKYINEYLNNNIPDRYCLDSLEKIYNTLKRQNKKTSSQNSPIQDTDLKNELVDIIQKTHDIPKNFFIKMIDAKILIPFEDKFEISKGNEQAIISYLFSSTKLTHTAKNYISLFTNKQIQNNIYKINGTKKDEYKEKLIEFKNFVDSCCKK